MSSTARRILALGESGRYEFKRDVDAVTPKLLAALANWVALDPAQDVAYLLVGVEEVEDKDTGLVSGRPFGLPKGLDKAVARVQDMASKTRPIPVDVFIVEEGVSTTTPFLRIRAPAHHAAALRRRGQTPNPSGTIDSSAHRRRTAPYLPRSRSRQLGRTRSRQTTSRAAVGGRVWSAVRWIRSAEGHQRGTSPSRSGAWRRRRREADRRRQHCGLRS